MRTQDQLLADFQEDNIRLVRENLRLRNQRIKLKLAFAAYVRRMESNFKVGVLDYRAHIAEPTLED